MLGLDDIAWDQEGFLGNAGEPGFGMGFRFEPNSRLSLGLAPSRSGLGSQVGAMLWVYLGYPSRPSLAVFFRGGTATWSGSGIRKSRVKGPTTWQASPLWVWALSSPTTKPASWAMLRDPPRSSSHHSSGQVWWQMELWSVPFPWIKAPSATTPALRNGRRTCRSPPLLPHSPPVAPATCPMC